MVFFVRCGDIWALWVGDMRPEVDHGNGDDWADSNFYKDDIPFEQSVHLQDGTHTIFNVIL